MAVVGRSGVGKTYLIEAVIPILKASGLRVATVKHTHHQVFHDAPGTDSMRHQEAGASRTVLAGPGFCIAFGEDEYPFEDVVRLAGRGTDLVLIEGYKEQPIRRIEVVQEGEPVLPAGEAWMTVTSEQSQELAEILIALCKSQEKPTSSE